MCVFTFVQGAQNRTANPGFVVWSYKLKSSLNWDVIVISARLSRCKCLNMRRNHWKRQGFKPNNAQETFVCLGSLILSFTCNFFAYFKFHSDWGRVIGKIKQNELDCRDTAPFTIREYNTIKLNNVISGTNPKKI